MSDHSIVYDLEYPMNGRMECRAAPDAQCKAVWDCECEYFHGFHVKDDQPHHWSGWDDGVSTHHVGQFRPGHCNLRDWHDGLDEDVIGTVRVHVEPDWHGDYVQFRAVAAELTTTEGA